MSKLSFRRTGRKKTTLGESLYSLYNSSQGSLGNYEGLFRTMTNIAVNTGYSYKKRLEKINFLLEENPQVYSKEQTEYLSTILNRLDYNVQKTINSKKRIKYIESVQEKISNIRERYSLNQAYSCLEKKAIEQEKILAERMLPSSNLTSLSAPRKLLTERNPYRNGQFSRVSAAELARKEQENNVQPSYGYKWENKPIIGNNKNNIISMVAMVLFAGILWYNSSTSHAEKEMKYEKPSKSIVLPSLQKEQMQSVSVSRYYFIK